MKKSYPLTILFFALISILNIDAQNYKAYKVRKTYSLTKCNKTTPSKEKYWGSGATGTKFTATTNGSICGFKSYNVEISHWRGFVNRAYFKVRGRKCSFCKPEVGLGD
jgi:hypothetical protein